MSVTGIVSRKFEFDGGNKVGIVDVDSNDDEVEIATISDLPADEFAALSVGATVEVSVVVKLSVSDIVVGLAAALVDSGSGQ